MYFEVALQIGNYVHHRYVVVGGCYVVVVLIYGMCYIHTIVLLESSSYAK